MVIGQSLWDAVVFVIIDPLILLIFSAGLVAFMWGLYEYMQGVEEPGKRETGQQHMLWGIIGMFIMIAAKGIIVIALDTFDINPNDIGNGAGVINRQAAPIDPFIQRR